MACEQCIQGFVMKDEPEGSMVGGAYVHEGTDKSKAVVLLTDIFGLPLVNCKLNADELSRRLSCDVWVPDYFAGNPPFKAEELAPLVPDRAGVTIPFMSQIKKIILFISHAPGFWASRPPVADSRIAEFITKLREEKNYTKIGAVGYCYGGAATVRLASKDLVDSVVVCHPGPVTTKELKAMKVPSAFVCAELDEYFGTKVRNGAEAIFAARKDQPGYIDYEFVDYADTAHGFAARPNLELPNIVEAYKKAMEQTSAWFAKTLEL